MPPSMNTAPSQAQRIIAKFGNARDLARALTLAADKGLIGRADVRTPATIYKWTWPIERGGTGGHIPRSAFQALKKAGRLVGVLVGMEETPGEDE